MYHKCVSRKGVCEYYSEQDQFDVCTNGEDALLIHDYAGDHTPEGYPYLSVADGFGAPFWCALREKEGPKVHKDGGSKQAGAKGNSPDNWEVKEMSLNDTLNFGKYRGKTLAYISEQDEGYYEWLINNNVISVSAE